MSKEDFKIVSASTNGKKTSTFTDSQKQTNSSTEKLDVLQELLEEIEEMREEETKIYDNTGGSSCAVRLLCLYEVRDLIKKKMEEEI